MNCRRTVFLVGAGLIILTASFAAFRWIRGNMGAAIVADAPPEQILPTLHERNYPMIASLSSALGNSDPHVRVKAVWALGKLGGPKAVDRLVRAMSDHAPTVQAAARTALMQQRKDILPRLMKTLARMPGDINGEGLAEVVAHHAEDAHLPALREIVRRGNEYARACATGALGLMEDTAAVTIIARRLTDDNAFVGAEAARALGRIGDSRAVRALLDGLHYPDPERRRACVRALGRIRDSSAVPALIGMLDDPVPDIRAAALSALSRIGGREAAVHFLKLIAEDDSLYRNFPDTVMGGLRKSALELADTLVVIVRHAGTGLRLAAVEMARACRCTAGSRVIRTALTDDIARVRRAAIRAVVEGKYTGAVPLLLRFARGDRPTEAREAVKALGMIGDRRAAPVLTGLLQSRYPDTDQPGADQLALWEEIARALGRLEHRAAVDPLVRSLRDTSLGPSRCTAAAALGMIGDTTATMPLIRRLDEQPAPTRITGASNRDIRGCVAAALGQLGDPRAREPLRKLTAIASLRPRVESALKRLKGKGSP